ncbi:class D beta-lactamase [Pseudoalteromonas sp. PPB1]|uniref:class D beta-lactamase n=1 Tax=Pseudoalteromonas sp. PPB1 TaxID=2756136 RepID=UPI00189189F5|nr:class D beta-lactamase [Pseudoalteromonas sp. PPB1]
MPLLTALTLTPLLTASVLSTPATLPACQTGQACTMAVYSERTQQWQFINQSRAQQAYTPFSTYKVPNTLILLDTQTIKPGQGYQIDLNTYPAKKWWFDAWRKESITPQDAFKYSALPLYQTWTNLLSKPVMQQYLDDFNYGNRDISGPHDKFWLNSSIKISAVEQVTFLRRLQTQAFKLKPATYQAFDKIFLQEQTANTKLYAKTGTGPVAKGKYIGWYVGIVENNQGRHYFAFNMDAKNFKEVVSTRVEIAKATLNKMGVL